ncbi:hypothetical protein Nepgr_023084 [Nepenthes gracilis]|uniref:Uncharacterized protein n=1 Tax=Nepenthes gracilis TaxID=150966 RepID=A0AAD3T385_NEPGR|nr:hypothetical protein Nepgr_023084 [Nepenthes gracilis]
MSKNWEGPCLDAEIPCGSLQCSFCNACSDDWAAFADLGRARWLSSSAGSALLFWVPSLHPILSPLEHDFTCSCYVVAFDAAFVVMVGCWLSSDVDRPSLFEYCGDGAALSGVVDVTSLLHMRTVLDSVLGWVLGFVVALRLMMSWPLPLLFLELAGRFSWAFHDPGLDRQFYLAAGYTAAAFRMPFAGLADRGLEAAKLHCALFANRRVQPDVFGRSR